MGTTKTPKHDPKWANAKTVCRLNMEDIHMAKALGMKPNSLMKNNPRPDQRWKQPVKYWIRELYEKRFGGKNARQPSPTFAQSQPSPARAEPVTFDENVPF